MPLNIMRESRVVDLRHGDCLAILPTLPENSVDSIVTDPPYGLSFMGRDWDHGVPGEHFWREMLRVLKPGGHVLAFGGTRTYHRMVCAMEDAGFEIRDTIVWVYGSGFPKSLDVSKAIDKAAGAQREALAQQWQGWGTGLKPAFEPITLARKPLEGTVTGNVLAHGTGALNIDGCRVPAPDAPDEAAFSPNAASRYVGVLNGGKESEAEGRTTSATSAGRWPANLIHDGSEEVEACFPKEKDNGSAARFFYCAKASKKDRDGGLGAFADKLCGMMEDDNYPIKTGSGNLRQTMRKNTHPTVKPTELMRYLCRLITPPGGTVLDPFMGSGSTGKAAMLEGFSFLGIELDGQYMEIARARVQHAKKEDSNGEKD